MRRHRRLASGKQKRASATVCGGVAAVAGVAGEQRPVAQVLPPVTAIWTDAAGRAEPGHADPLAQGKAGDAGAERRDPADDLMAGDDRQLRVRQFAVDHMQVGAAHAAGRDLDQDLAGPRLRQSAARAAPAAFRSRSSTMARICPTSTAFNWPAKLLHQTPCAPKNPARPPAGLSPAGLADRNRRSRRLAASDRDDGPRQAQAQAQSSAGAPAPLVLDGEELQARVAQARRQAAAGRKLRRDAGPADHPAAAEPAVRARDRNRDRSDRPIPSSWGSIAPATPIARNARPKASAASPISPTGRT